MRLINARIWTPWREIYGGVSCAGGATGGRFIQVGALDNLGAGIDDIDCQGWTLTPGFVDRHCHGGGGHDFMDGGDAIAGAARAHMRFGTTTLLPTTVAGDMDELQGFLRDFATLTQSGGMQELPNMPGLHLEGPYFDMSQRGAQDPAYIKPPDPAEYLPILDTGLVRRWTVAPELPGAHEMAAELRRRGIVPSIGHTAALYTDMQAAWAAGFTHVTHLYSGMQGVVRVQAFRHGGGVEGGLLLPLTVEIIADGCHLPQELIQLVYRLKGVRGMCLVTDGMRAAGQDVSESIIGSLQRGQSVIVEDGVAKLPDRSAFAGSVATADRLVRTAIAAGIPPRQAVAMMTAVPADIMGLRTGRIAAGWPADAVLLDTHYQVRLVMRAGRVVYRSGI